LSGQREDGGVANATAELYRRIDALAVRVGADAPWRAANAADLDLLSVAEWVEQESLSTPASELVTVLTRTLFGAEPGNTSMLFLANYVAQGDDAETLTGTDGAAQAIWIVEGAYRLPVLLADALGERVRLRSPVIAITQNAERCMVGTETALYTANRVIVALPPPLADTIAFDPPLPLLRARLQHGARMGDYQKVILRYDRPFWRDVGLSGLSASSLGPITNTLEKSASADGGMLVGFVGGCWAQRLSAMPADERHATLTKQLVRLFGEVARCPVSIHVEDWSADIWTRGGPVQVMPPGLLSAVGDVLRTPSGRVHWAGTEPASKWTGYMDGAVRAGDAAALQVISLLRDHLGTA
jgi:monoamine oxidase